MNDKIILKKFSERLSSLVKDNNIEISQLANMLGIRSKSTIYRYMNAEMAPKITTIKYLAEIYNVNEVWLMGYDVPMKKTPIDSNINIANGNALSFPKNFLLVPIYGKISAGEPKWVDENIEGTLPIDPNLFGIANPQECFFLRVTGESMNKIIRNGAFALIRKQDFVDNGEIAVVLVNGFDATLKKFTKQDNLIILEPQSDDSSFKTQVYDKDTQIKVLGKYIGKMEIND